MMPNLIFFGAVSQEAAGYSIVFLDVPGCASSGATLDEVLAMGKEALEGHLEVSLDFGDPIPQPSEHTLADVDAWLFDGEIPDAQFGTWIGLYPIEVTLPEQQDTVPIRVNADLMQRIAELSRVTARQIDSRRFIEDAVEHELELYRKSAA